MKTFFFHTVSEPAPVIVSSAFSHSSSETTKIRPNLPEEEVNVDMIVLAKRGPMRWQRGKIVDIITKGKNLFFWGGGYWHKLRNWRLNSKQGFSGGVLWERVTSFGMAYSLCRPLTCTKKQHKTIEERQSNDAMWIWPVPLIDISPFAEDGRLKYKVSFEEKGRSLVSGHHIAFDTTPRLEQLYVGARVVVKCQDNNSLFRPGVLAELPSRKNRLRWASIPL